MKPNMFAHLWYTAHTYIIYHLGTLLLNQPEKVDAIQCKATKLTTPPLDTNYQNRYNYLPI